MAMKWRVVPLKETRVDDVLTMLEESDQCGRGHGVSRTAKTLSRVRIVADSRGNRLLLKGDADSRKRLRELIATLDTPVQPDRLGGVKGFPVEACRGQAGSRGAERVGRW
jgi:general secretion pathway protein D